MRRSRMTMRRWMVAVAVVGLLLGVVVGAGVLRSDGITTCNRRMTKLDRRITSAPWRRGSPHALHCNSLRSFVERTYSVAELAAE